MGYLNGKTNTPAWRDVTVASHLPSKLKPLAELAHNFWWSWHDEATELFTSMDEKLWEEVGKNPVMLLEHINYERLEELSNDDEFMAKLEHIYAQFKEYMSKEPDHTRPSVAYFCMEYGISNILKIYSGGLGILAGDYLKEASDCNVDMCAVGLLYRYGYFDQSISMDGQQHANYEMQNFGKLPIEKVMDENGKQLVIHVPYTDYFVVHANVWRVNVGRVSLYLLDTDNDLNSEFDRPITYHLYGGDWENRLKQEILLGIGGMMLLEKLGIQKNIYHCNEGHAALLNLRRLCIYKEQGLTFEEAMELVRASSLYTVHTPVPAGHDYFDEGLFRKYMEHYCNKLGIAWDDLMNLGRNNPGDHNERFCLSIFACKTCQEVNGVSLLHGQVSQQMFAPIWKGYLPEENHVGYVTNGVHWPTWCASEWKQLYLKHFDANFIHAQSDERIWQAIYEVDDNEIWEVRCALKRKLIDYIRQRCTAGWIRNQMDPSLVVSTVEKFNPNALLIGFSRRFATYKRAYLLFADEARLSRLVNDPNRPVQFIFAGKAHPDDGAGQDLIKRIVNLSHKPEFLGKIIFLENYDIELARRLVSGVDVWLNTPTRLAEASGTSGEKALMNGVLNFSVMDGWWYEGYREKAGWMLSDKTIYENAQYQDNLDSAAIYAILELSILPLYYERNGKEYSEGWIRYIKNSIAQIAPHYTMKRQLDDYYEKFYNKLYKHFDQLAANDFRSARELAAWKSAVAANWDAIEVVSIEANNALNATIEAGKEYEIRAVIDQKGLVDAIGVECVATYVENGKEHIYSVTPLDKVKSEGSVCTYQTNVSVSNAGSYKLAFRMYPKHKLLPHRQDFCYVRWF